VARDMHGGRAEWPETPRRPGRSAQLVGALAACAVRVQTMGTRGGGRVQVQPPQRQRRARGRGTPVDARTPRAHRATRRPRRGACRHGTPAWGSVHTPPHGVTKPAAGRGAATTTPSSKSGRVSAAAGRAALSAPRSCLLVDASGIQPEFCSDL